MIEAIATSAPPRIEVDFTGSPRMLISLFGSLGQVFITYAYRFAPASEISIYNYSGILFSILLGAGILGEPVKSTSLLGGALVAVASIMVYIYGNSKKPVRR